VNAARVALSDHVQFKELHMPASKRVNKCSIEEQADSSDCDGGKKLHDHIGRTIHRELLAAECLF
jgi:hypothetical protein